MALSQGLIYCISDSVKWPLYIEGVHTSGVRGVPLHKYT